MLLSFSRKASDVSLKKNILEKYYTGDISLLQMDFNTYIFSAPARVFLMSSTCILKDDLLQNTFTPKCNYSRKYFLDGTIK